MSSQVEDNDRQVNHADEPSDSTESALGQQVNDGAAQMKTETVTDTVTEQTEENTKFSDEQPSSEQSQAVSEDKPKNVAGDGDKNGTIEPKSEPSIGENLESCRRGAKPEVQTCEPGNEPQSEPTEAKYALDGHHSDACQADHDQQTGKPKSEPEVKELVGAKFPTARGELTREPTTTAIEPTTTGQMLAQSETQEVSSTRNEDHQEQSKQQNYHQASKQQNHKYQHQKGHIPKQHSMRSSSRRPSYNNTGRAYAGGYQNYGLAYLPYKSNFEPSEDAKRRADEFLQTLKL